MEKKATSKPGIQPSILIAAFLAVSVTLWIASGQTEKESSSGYQKMTEEPAPPPAIRELPKVRVTESLAQPHRAILLYTGRTEASRRAVIRAETEGRVVEVAAQESSLIEEGALMVRLAASDRYAILQQAQALVRQREIEYKAAQSLAGKGFQTESARAEAESHLSAAKAALEQIRVDLARITVEAPFTGIVESRTVEIGDYVQRGDEVAHLADFDPILVTVQVTEKEVVKVEDGAIAEIELVSGEKSNAIVSRIATRADPITRTFEVELEVANQDVRLLDGMTAKVLLPAQQVMAHKITPALLTLNNAGIVGVKALDEDNRVIFYPVQIVEDTAGGMWVGGLPYQITLITVGHAFVDEGVIVDPVPADQTARSDADILSGEQT